MKLNRKYQKNQQKIKKNDAKIKMIQFLFL
jgi:hypothetical protein